MTNFHVAHVLRKLDPAEWGGTETHVSALGAALQRRGVDSSVWAPALHERHPRISGEAVERYRAMLPMLGPKDALTALWRRGGNIVSADLLFRLVSDDRSALAHVHTLGRIGGVVRTAMRWTGRPYVVSVHGPLLAEPTLVRDDVTRAQRRVLDLGSPIGALLGARRVLDDASRVVCFNDDEFAALQARVGERAVRLDQGVEREHYARGSAERGRQRWALPGGVPVVLQLGRLAEQKNPQLTLRAFAAAAHPTARLVFAGSETEAGLTSTLTQEAAALGLGARVTFLGNVDREDVPDLLALSAVLMLPSRHESFGLTLLEAWAALRPALFSKVGGFADLAAAACERDLVIQGTDPAVWGAALKRALVDPDLRAAAARRGETLVRRRFGWGEVARRHRALYEEVVEERTHSRGRVHAV